jgi:uncharacterized damage-inducible protein DinB
MTGSTNVDPRVDPPFESGERESYDAWLLWHRQTLLVKCAGLDAAQLRTRAVASSLMSLHGLVRHMAEVERNWFQRVLAGEDAPPLFYDNDTNPEGDFEMPDDASFEDDLAAWHAQVARADEIAAAHELDDTGRHRSGADVSLRWIYVHMIEEYARHNGHADLLRELIDGTTGD